MKNIFSFGAITTFAAIAHGQVDDERKVPPRTPPQRLNTLQRFAHQWIDAQIGIEINRPGRAYNMKLRGVNRLFDKMMVAYEKPCHYFNPLTKPHGGPNPLTQGRKYTYLYQSTDLI